MESFLFSKQSPTEVATSTAAGKLSNGAALVVKELRQEPCKGLLHVVNHVQKSVPGLLETHRGLEATAAQLQAVLSELQDAQDGMSSVTSPATQQDLQQLAGSMQAMQQLQQQQQLQLQAMEASVAAAAGTDASVGTKSSSLVSKLFDRRTTASGGGSSNTSVQ